MVVTSQVFKVIGCKHNNFVHVYDEEIYGEQFEVWICDSCGKAEKIKIVE